MVTEMGPSSHTSTTSALLESGNVPLSDSAAALLRLVEADAPQTITLNEAFIYF